MSSATPRPRGALDRERQGHTKGGIAVVPARFAPRSSISGTGSSESLPRAADLHEAETRKREMKLEMTFEGMTCLECAKKREKALRSHCAGALVVAAPIKEAPPPATSLCHTGVSSLFATANTAAAAIGLDTKACDQRVAFRRSRKRKEVMDYAEVHDHESLRGRG